MNLNDRPWKSFTIDSIFDIKKGKRLTAENQIDGINPYIGAIDDNNGVSNYIEQKPIHQGNTITVNYNGSVGEAFYQPVPFWATDDVNVLYFKKNHNVQFNKYIAFFICTIIKKDKYRWSYGRKWHMQSMKKSQIFLPVDSYGKPDWNFMENYIKSLYYQPISTNNKCNNILNLNVKAWKFFKLGDLFDIMIAPSSDLGNLDSGSVSFIGRTDINNGLQAKVNVESNKIIKGNCITISMVGTNIALWQPEEFTASQNIAVLKRKNLNVFIALFICTLINFEMKLKFNYGRTVNKVDIEKMILKLPVTCHGEPDWKFMENYISTLPYGDRIK